MKTKRIIRILTILSCIAAAILLIVALHLFRPNHDDSPGWRLLKTQDSYTLDSQQMNGTDSHTLKSTFRKPVRTPLPWRRGTQKEAYIFR